MRKILAVATLAAAAASIVPATSASASCVYVGVGGCINPCTAVGSAYRAADTAAGDALPALGMNCTL